MLKDKRAYFCKGGFKAIAIGAVFIELDLYISTIIKWPESLDSVLLCIAVSMYDAS